MVRNVVVPAMTSVRTVVPAAESPNRRSSIAERMLRNHHEAPEPGGFLRPDVLADLAVELLFRFPRTVFVELPRHSGREIWNRHELLGRRRVQVEGNEHVLLESG